MGWIEKNKKKNKEKAEKLRKAEFFEKKKNPGARQSYNIAVVGMGNLGTETAKRLSTIQNQVFPKIKGSYLLSKDESKLGNIYNELSRVSEGEFNFIKTINTANIEDYVNEFDICILTLDAEEAAPIDLITSDNIARINRFNALTKKNFNMIETVASSFKKDYYGTVILLTNLPEIMSYSFLQNSELDPRQIIPMTHTDTIRVKRVLNDAAGLLYNAHVSVENVYGIGHHQSPWPYVADAIIPQPTKLFRGLSEEDEKELSNYLINPKGFLEQEIVKPFIEQESFKKLSPKEKGIKLKRITLNETVDAILETVKAIMNQKKGAISGGAFLPKEGLYAELPLDILGCYALPKENFLEELPVPDKKEFYKRINGYQGVKEVNEIIGLKPTIKRLKHEGLIKSSSPVFIHNPLKIELPVDKRKETFIVGAAGEVETVYFWNKVGERIRKIPVTIGGKPKFAASVKYFNYEGKDYILIGTSAGIQLNSLTDPSFRKEMMITQTYKDEEENKIPLGEIGHIKDMAIIDDIILGSDYHISLTQETGKGIFRANIEEVLNSDKPVELGNIFQEPAGPLAIVDYNGEKTLVFPSKNNLQRFIPGHGTFSPIFQKDHDYYITALTKDGFAMGDSKGYVILLDEYQNIKSKHLINLNLTPIASLEHVAEQGDHLLIGSKNSYFKHYTIIEGQLKKQSSNRLIKNMFEEEKKNNTHDSKLEHKAKYPVENISYVKLEDKGYAYMTREHDILSVKFSKLLQEKKENLPESFDNYNELFGEVSRTIYGLEICTGEKNES